MRETPKTLVARRPEPASKITINLLALSPSLTQQAPARIQGYGGGLLRSWEETHACQSATAHMAGWNTWALPPAADAARFTQPEVLNAGGGPLASDGEATRIRRQERRAGVVAHIAPLSVTAQIFQVWKTFVNVESFSVSSYNATESAQSLTESAQSLPTSTARPGFMQRCWSRSMDLLHCNLSQRNETAPGRPQERTPDPRKGRSKGLPLEEDPSRILTCDLTSHRVRLRRPLQKWPS